MNNTVTLQNSQLAPVELQALNRPRNPAVVAYVVRDVPKIDNLSSALSNLDTTIQDQYRRSRELVDHMPTAQNEVLGPAPALSDKTRDSLNPRNFTELAMEQFSALERAFKAIQNASYKALGFWGYVKRFFLSSRIESKIFQVMRSLMNLQRIEHLRTTMSGLFLSAFKASTQNQNTADCEALSARITAFYNLRQAIPGNWTVQFKELQDEYKRLVQNTEKNKRKLNQLQVENIRAERLLAIGGRLDRLGSDVKGYDTLYRGLKNKDFRLLKQVSVGRFLDGYDLSHLIQVADLTLQKIEEGQIGHADKEFIKQIKRIAGMLPKFRSPTIEPFLEQQNSRPLERVVKGMQARDFDLEATIQQADATLKDLFKNDTGGVAERQYLEKIEMLSQSILNFTSPTIEQALDALRTLRQIEAINQGS